MFKYLILTHRFQKALKADPNYSEEFWVFRDNLILKGSQVYAACKWSDGWLLELSHFDLKGSVAYATSYEEAFEFLEQNLHTLAQQVKELGR